MSDEFATSREELEHESQLLPRQPPPQALRVLTDIVLGSFLVAAVFVAMVRLPSTVTGRFVLRPESGADPIHAEWDGTVESLAVNLGDRVATGDTLFVLRAEGLRQLASERATLSSDLATDRQRLAVLTSPAPLPGEVGEASELRARVTRLERQLEIEAELASTRDLHDLSVLDAARGELSRRDHEVTERDERAKALQEIVDMVEKAHAEGVMAKRAVLEARDRQDDAQAELEEARSARNAAAARVRVLEREKDVFTREREMAWRELEGQLAEASGALRDSIVQLKARIEAGESRLTYIVRALEGADGDLLAVKAPYAGIVSDLGVDRPHVTVARGQVICELSPVDATLVAYLTIPEVLAARVEPGQIVRLLFDAYPYTRHGVKPGTLTWVSPRARDGSITAIAQVWEDSFVVDGVSRPLRAGLAGEARVRIGEHSLMEYVLAPLREFRESVMPGRLQRKAAPPARVKVSRPAVGAQDGAEAPLQEGTTPPAAAGAPADATQPDEAEAPPAEPAPVPSSP